MFASTATVTGNVVIDGMILILTPHVAMALISCRTQGSFKSRTTSSLMISVAGPMGRPLTFPQPPIMTSSRTTSSINGPENTAIINDGSGNTISPNDIDKSGYLDPNRSVGSYMASLGGGATLDAFLAAARDQSKSNWNPQLHCGCGQCLYRSRF